MVSLDPKFFCQMLFSCCSFAALVLSLLVALYMLDVGENHLGF